MQNQTEIDQSGDLLKDYCAIRVSFLGLSMNPISEEITTTEVESG